MLQPTDSNDAQRPKDPEPATSKDQTETRADRIIRRLKDHPVVSILVVLGVIVITLGAFTDAVERIAQIFRTGDQPQTPEYVYLQIDATAVPEGSHVTVTDSTGQTIAETTGGPSEIKIPIPRRYLGQQITVKVTVPGYAVQTYVVTVTDEMIIPTSPEGR